MVNGHATFAARDRCRNEIGELARGSANPTELLDGVLELLHTRIAFDGAFVSATDPTTILFSQAGVVENLPPTMCAPWLDNEFAVEDFNKYADMHRAQRGPTTLHRSTSDQPERSKRHREVNTACGFGFEMRATFGVDGACWGVINLLRTRGAHDFDDTDLDFVDAIGDVVAKGLRRFVLASPAGAEPYVGPGIIILDAGGMVVSMTDRAAAYLGELSHPAVEHRGSTLPGEAYMVGTRARARAAGLAAAAPIVRTRGRNGQWLTLRADCSRDSSGNVTSTAVVIEPSRNDEVLPLFVAAHGLSPREQAVLAELVQGATTAEIARMLHISPHTVRDHVKSLHDKVGVRSRAELVSQLYQLHYAPESAITHRG